MDTSSCEHDFDLGDLGHCNCKYHSIDKLGNLLVGNEGHKYGILHINIHSLQIKIDDLRNLIIMIKEQNNDVEDITFKIDNVDMHR